MDHQRIVRHLSQCRRDQAVLGREPKGDARRRLRPWRLHHANSKKVFLARIAISEALDQPAEKGEDVRVIFRGRIVNRQVLESDDAGAEGDRIIRLQRK